MDAEHIGQVRRFNRLVTQRVGALEQSYLRRGRPLGEARLIFETRAEGAELRALRNRLGLDSGYLSRLLRSLEAQGLVTVEGESADRRRRRVQLTSEGRADWPPMTGSRTSWRHRCWRRSAHMSASISWLRWRKSSA